MQSISNEYFVGSFFRLCRLCYYLFWLASEKWFPWQAKWPCVRMCLTQTNIFVCHHMHTIYCLPRDRERDWEQRTKNISIIHRIVSANLKWHASYFTCYRLLADSKNMPPPSWPLRFANLHPNGWAYGLGMARHTLGAPFAYNFSSKPTDNDTLCIVSNGAKWIWFVLHE